MWVKAGALLEAAFRLDGPMYDPPYESPIEDAFAWHFVKHLDAATKFETQVEARTVCGVFRMDFVAASGDRRIGFECDGADYHNELRDECRDAVILWSGEVDAVYRLRGADLNYRMDDVLMALVTAEPELFSPRGHLNVRQLGHGVSVRGIGTGLLVAERRRGDGERPNFPVWIDRHSLESRYLRAFAEFASQRGGRLDERVLEFVNRPAAEVA